MDTELRRRIDFVIDTAAYDTMSVGRRRMEEGWSFYEDRSADREDFIDKHFARDHVIGYFSRARSDHVENYEIYDLLKETASRQAAQYM